MITDHHAGGLSAITASHVEGSHVLQLHVVLLRNLDEGAPLKRFAEARAESKEGQQRLDVNFLCIKNGTS